jgi:hypothetical protein
LAEGTDKTEYLFANDPPRTEKTIPSSPTIPKMTVILLGERRSIDWPVRATKDLPRTITKLGPNKTIMDPMQSSNQRSSPIKLPQPTAPNPPKTVAMTDTISPIVMK